MQRIRRELPALSPQVRTAFAAAAAERTLPIVKKQFGDTETCDKALEVAWRFVEGESIDEDEVKALVDEIDAMVDELYEADEVGHRLYALNAISHAMESTITPESEMAEDAAIDAQSAADIGAGKIGETYIEEEANWQMRALDIALEAKQPSRNLFRSLPTESTWLKALRSRP